MPSYYGGSLKEWPLVPISSVVAGNAAVVVLYKFKHGYGVRNK
jgi:hypothetical protein